MDLEAKGPSQSVVPAVAQHTHLAEGALTQQLGRAVRDGAILFGLHQLLRPQVSRSAKVRDLGLVAPLCVRRFEQYVTALQVCIMTVSRVVSQAKSLFATSGSPPGSSGTACLT